MPKPLIFLTTIEPGDTLPVCDLLARATGLPKARIKDAMNKGAVWHKPAAGRQRRLRRATTVLPPGDQLALYYDADILKRSPLISRCVSDRRRFSVWVKPPGLLTQATR